MQSLTLEEMVAAEFTHQQIADELNITRNAARKRAKRLKERLNVVEVATSVTQDVQRLRQQQSTVDLKSKYTAALRTIDDLESNLGALLMIQATPRQIFKIEQTDGGEDESTAVIVASDWHVEENVVAGTVNYLNEYTLAIAEQRINKFAENTVKLLNMFAKTGKLKKAVLALLGDFISGYIHDELMELNELAPVEASVWAKDRIFSVIQHILDNTSLEKLTIVCKCGNHTRTTQKVRFSSEAGNSLEFFIYDVIAQFYANNPRVEVIFEKSYLTYLKIYDVTVRFHHGHALKYNGGVGGLYIPVHKAIDQWNRGNKADLDVFGHWHQMIASDRFIVNGSIIGYNGYAVSIKAGYEPPRQAFFLINSKYGKTITCPIFVED